MLDVEELDATVVEGDSIEDNEDAESDMGLDGLMEVLEVLEVSIISKEVDDVAKNTVEEANDVLYVLLFKEVVNVEEMKVGVVELDSVRDSEDNVSDEVSCDRVVSLIGDVEGFEVSVVPKEDDAVEDSVGKVEDDAVEDSVGKVEDGEVLEVDVIKVRESVDIAKVEPDDLN